jgi:hypothetical protein
LTRVKNVEKHERQKNLLLGNACEKEFNQSDQEGTRGPSMDAAMHGSEIHIAASAYFQSSITRTLTGGLRHSTVEVACVREK